MTTDSFELHSGETFLYRAQPARKWYILAWKVGSGLFATAVFTLAAYAILTKPVEGLLANILPASTANTLTLVLCLGLVPLLALAWAAEDVAQAMVGEIILTSQRLWVKGSPYAWSQEQETQLDEIASMKFRRDALFLRLKSTHKLQVHMFPDGRQIVRVYEQFMGIEKPK
jgi:hypothetical protein